MKHNWLKWLVATVAAMALLASCSETLDESSPTDDDSTATENEQAEPETRTMRGITDDSIKVGGVQYGLFFGDAELGVRARIDKANAEGGVHGRQIEFLGAEENNNEATNDLDIVRRLVEQEEVFALLPVMSGTFGAGEYAEDNNVPFFGYGINPAFCESKVAFGLSGCVTNPSLSVASNALGTALVDYFNGDTDKTIAFLGEDNDAGKGGVRLLTASTEDKGFTVVLEDTSFPAPPEQAGDVSPFVNRLITADNGEAPDVIYLQTTLAGTQIAAALQAAGYAGEIITPSYSPILLGAPGYVDVLVNTQFGMDPTIPANAEMMEAVAAIDPDQQMSLALLVGYYSADMFIAGLEATGEDLTVETFLQTMNNGFQYSVDGVVGPSEWPENNSKPVPCAVMSRTTEDAFEPLQDLVCGNNFDL